MAEAAALGPRLDWQESQQLDLRNEAIACMTLTDVRLAQPLHRTPPGARVLAFDTDLENYAWSTDRGEMHLVRVKDHQELFTLPGPGDRAHVAEFSPNGHLLAAKYHDDAGPPEVKVWDLTANSIVWESAGDQFRFSPDSRHLAIGDIDSSMQLINLETRQVVDRFVTHAQPGCLRFHPAEPRLAVASLYSRDVQIKDSHSGEVMLTLAHPESVFALQWNAAGTLLACACTDHHIYVWDSNTGQLRTTLLGHRAEAVDVMFDHAGDLVASHGWDHSTRLWTALSGQQRLSFDARPHGFSVNDHRLVCTNNEWSAGDEVRLFDLATGNESRELLEPQTPSKGPYHLDVSRDGRLLLSTGPEGVIIWDLATYRPIGHLDSVSHEIGWSSSASLFAPNGESLFTTGPDGLSRWPIVRTRDERHDALIIGPSLPIFSAGRVEKASLDRAGHTIAFVHNYEAYVARLDSSDPPLRLAGHTGVAHIAISPDGQWIATGTWHGRGVVTWNAQTGQRLDDLFPAADSATVAMSPDGKWLAAGANEVCRIWEMGTWKLVREIPAAYPYIIAFSPELNTLALTESSHGKIGRAHV